MIRHLLATLLIFPTISVAQGTSSRPNLERVEELMGVYLVHSPRRHESEKVVYKRGTLKIDLWHPVHRMSDVDLKTRAVQWLVFGRTQYSTGARGVFSEMPMVKRVILRFHEVVRAGKNTRRRVARERRKRFLALSLTRKDFEKLELGPLETCREQTDCERLFKRGFSKAFFDARYTAKRRREI